MRLDRQAVIESWTASIREGYRRIGREDDEAEARAHATATADALPGLFRDDVIELEGS